MSAVEHLRVAVAEDEAVARAARWGDGVWWRRTWKPCQDSDQDEPVGALFEGEQLLDADGEVFGGDDVVVYDEGAPSDAQFTHIARWDPARVLRGVEADRKLLAAYDQALAALAAYEADDGEWPGTPEEWADAGFHRRAVVDILHGLIKARAEVYAP